MKQIYPTGKHVGRCYFIYKYKKINFKIVNTNNCIPDIKILYKNIYTIAVYFMHYIHKYKK